MATPRAFGLRPSRPARHRLSILSISGHAIHPFRSGRPRAVTVVGIRQSRRNQRPWRRPILEDASGCGYNASRADRRTDPPTPVDQSPAGRRLMAETGPASRPVLVLDFGAQYVQLIARRVRERHAFARIVRHDITAERVRELDPLALILSGGPKSVYEPGRPDATRPSSRSACRSWASATACSSPSRPWAAGSRPTRRGASTAGPTAA